MAFHEVQWYDRNPLVQRGAWGAVAMPHAVVERLSYTVPKDKLAMLEFVECSVVRVTVAAPVGRAQAFLQITPEGLTGRVILRARIQGNNIEDRADAWVGLNLLLREGDQIQLFTSDASTGGTCDYDVSYALTEFDAYLYHAPPKTRPLPEIDVQEPSKYPSDPEM